MINNNDTNPFLAFERFLSTVGSGDVWQGVLLFLLIVCLIFNIPTLITAVKGKGYIKVVDMFGKSILNMGLAMTPFTFPLGYMGLWASIKESLESQETQNER